MSKVPLRAPAGMPLEQRPAHLRTLARADLVRVARLMGLPDGEAPSAEQYQEHGRYGLVMLTNALGEPTRKWRPAMDRAGLKHSRNHRRATDAQLLRDIRRVAMHLGRPDAMPTRAEYAEHGQYSPSLLEIRLGEEYSGSRSWERVAAVAGMTARHGNAQARRDEDVLNDYRRACTAARINPGDYGLSQPEFNRAVPYSANLPRVRFGSWRAFVEAAGYRARPPKRAGVVYETGAQQRGRRYEEAA